MVHELDTGEQLFLLTKTGWEKWRRPLLTGLPYFAIAAFTIYKGLPFVIVFAIVLSGLLTFLANAIPFFTSISIFKKGLHIKRLIRKDIWLPFEIINEVHAYPHGTKSIYWIGRGSPIIFPVLRISIEGARNEISVKHAFNKRELRALFFQLQQLGKSIYEHDY